MADALEKSSDVRQLSSEAFLLDVFDLQEQDRVVTFLTPEYGKKRGVARGARRKYSRHAGKLQMLARVSVTWFERDQTDLVRIQDVSLLQAANILNQSLETLLAGSFLAEQAAHFAQENEANEDLYRLIDATLRALEAGGDLDVLTRYFEVWVLRLSGLLAPPRECPTCGRAFSDGAVLPPLESALVCRACASATVAEQSSEIDRDHADSGVATLYPRDLLDFLLAMSTNGPAEISKSRPPHRSVRQIEGLCRSIRRRFLGYELKSYGVMQRTLSQVQLAEKAQVGE